MCVCVCVCVCVVCVLVLGPTLGGPRLAPEEPHRLCGAYVCPRSLGLPSHGREQVPAPHLPGPFWALLYPPSPWFLLDPTPSPISPVPSGPYPTAHLPGPCWALPNAPPLVLASPGCSPAWAARGVYQLLFQVCRTSVSWMLCLSACSSRKSNMYLMARGSALPRCTVLNKVSNKSSTNFCRVPWGRGGGRG